MRRMIIVITKCEDNDNEDNNNEDRYNKDNDNEDNDNEDNSNEDSNHEINALCMSNGTRDACSTSDIIDCLLVYKSTSGLLVVYLWSPSDLVVPQLKI